MKDIKAGVEEGMKGFNRSFQNKATDYISIDLLDNGVRIIRRAWCCAPLKYA